MPRPWNIPDPAMIRDPAIRAIIEPIAQNVRLLFGQFSNRSTERALTAEDLISLGIVGNDNGTLYSKVNAIARSYVTEAAQAQGGASVSGATTAGAIQTATRTITFSTGTGEPVGQYSAGIELPAGAVIIRAWYYVTAAFEATSAHLLPRATLSIGVATDDEEGIAEEAAADDDAWAVGLHLGMQHKTAPVPYTNIATAARNVVYTVGDNGGGGLSILTAGTVVLVCEYVVFA